MTTSERAVLRKKILSELKYTRTMYGLASATGATEAEVSIVLNELHRAKVIDARRVHGFRVLEVAPVPQPLLGDGDW
jgi:hypothetical protein